MSKSDSNPIPADDARSTDRPFTGGPSTNASPTSPPPAPAGGPAPGFPTRTAPPPASWGDAGTARRSAPAAAVLGIMLVVAGGLVLVARLLDVAIGPHAWPLWIIVPGAALLVASVAVPDRGGLGMAIPGAILLMLGLVLWVQDTYGLYATWAYAWALVAPTGVGLGMLFHGLVRGDRDLVTDGLRTTLVGLALFIGFALLFEGVIGISGHRVEHLDEVLPYGAIGLGLVLVTLSLVGGGYRRHA